LVRDYLASNPQILKELEQNTSFLPADVESITVIMPEFGGPDIVEHPLVVVRTAQPYDKLKLIRTLRFKPDLHGRHYILGRGTHLFIVDERTVLFGWEPARDLGPEERARRDGDSMLAYCAWLLKRAEHGPLDGAIAEATRKHAIVAGLNVPELAKSLPDMLLPVLDKFKALLAAKSALLTLDMKDELSLAVTVEAADIAAAKQATDSLRVFLALAKEALPEMRKRAKNSPMAATIDFLVGLAEMGMAKATVESQGAIVRLTTSVKADGAFEAALKAVLAQMNAARERISSVNNLKQLSLAILNFHEAYGQFPFPGLNKNGAPLAQGMINANLSWRVAILPYIEEQNTYQEFHLDEPWDSEHNKKLIEKMPKIFAPVNGVKADKGHTFYQIFTGSEAFQAGTTMLSVTDGLSNTLMIVEAGQGVPWSKPDDLVYDSKKPLPKLGGLFDGNFNAALCDGSVHYFRKDIPEKVLRALITINGGEAFDWDWDK
jgi:Protein of unknown function (DUF1559)